MIAGTMAKRPEPVCGLNAWLPIPARVLKIHRENFNTISYELQIVDPEIRAMYRWQPGQFNMLYLPGVVKRQFPSVPTASRPRPSRTPFASSDRSRGRLNRSTKVTYSACAARSAPAGQRKNSADKMSC
jgi:hypothetical protein